MTQGFHGPHEILNRVGRQHAERIDQRKSVHVAFVCDAQDQIEHPIHFRAREIDGEKYDFEPLLMRERRGLNGKIDGLFHRPLIRVLDDVLAGRHFHHDAGNAAIHGALHVVHHAARKRENLRAKISLHDFLDGRFIARRHDGHARLDAMNSRFPAKAFRRCGSYRPW